jgi:carbonic anhydrase/acetyltransferase-like protein (isoleucine patch superfamily)
MLLNYKNNIPKIDENAFIFKNTVIIGDTKIEKETSIWFGTIIRGDVNYIKIGKRTNIQDNSMIHVTTAKYPVAIGNNVTIGHTVTIHGSKIGNNVLIGMGAIILDGCQIEEYSLIAAGTVLRENSKIPSGVLVAGNPGKIKRELSQKEIDFFQKSADNYLKYSKNYLTHSPESLYSLQELKNEQKRLTSLFIGE